MRPARSGDSRRRPRFRRLALASVVVWAAISVGASGAARGAGSAGTPRAVRSAGCGATTPVPPGVSTATIVSDGVLRTYQLDVPAGYTGRKPFGLVLGLHPLSISYLYMSSIVRFAQNTKRFGFIGVAPSGLLDDGTPYWDAAPTKHNYDIDFISKVISHLEAKMCIDPRRVFSTGISNGAQMSSLVGCRLSAQVDAIAPVEGEEFLAPCRGKPMPIMAFHGTADPILPFSGGGLNATTIANLYYWHGKVPPGLPAPLGIDESMRLWAAHNGCRPHYRSTRIAPDVVKRTWQGCKAATVLYVILGGGHGWPGQPVPSLEKEFGPDTTSIDATNLIMKFFFDPSSRTRPGGTGLSPAPST